MGSGFALWACWRIPDFQSAHLNCRETAPQCFGYHLISLMLKRLKPLAPYLWKYRLPFFFGGLSVLLTNGIWVFFPQVIRRAVDDLNTGVTRHKLIVYSLAIIVLALAKSIFQFLTRWI